MINVPMGLGVHVHSEITPIKRIKPYFKWVRFDVSENRDRVKEALDHYGEMEEGIVWLVQSLEDLKMITSCTSNAIIEVINEPDQEFPNRPKINPSAHKLMMEDFCNMAISSRYIFCGPNLSSWNKTEPWFYKFLENKGTNSFDVIGHHTYGTDTKAALWEIINRLKLTWPNKPQLITEYCYPRKGIPPGTWAARHFSVIQQARYEKVGICTYCMPYTTDGNGLLDQKGEPTLHYKHLMGRIEEAGL